MVERSNLTSYKQRFFYFCVTGILVISAVFYLGTSFVTNHYFLKQKEDYHRVQLGVMGATLDRYFSNHFIILHDFAENAVVVNNLMQFNKRSIRLNDFISTAKVLGEKGEFSIYSFDGEPFVKSSFSHGEWLNEILEGKKREYVGLIESEGEYLLEFAVPILYNGTVEGVFRFVKRLSDQRFLSVASGNELILKKNDLKVIFGKKKIIDRFSSYIISPYGFEIEIVSDLSSFKKNRNNFFLVLFLISVFLAYFVGYLFYRKGREYFVDPHEQLVSLNDELSNLSGIKDAIFNSTSFGIIATDLDGEIKTFNSSAEKMLGYDSSEVVDKVTPAIIHEVDEVIARAKELTDEVGKTIEPGFEVFVHNVRKHEFEKREWTYIRKDGSKFPVKLVVSAIRDREKNIIGFVGTFEDITKYKEAEKTREKALEEIKMNAEMKSQFLATMSHEIRTPMNGVIGLTELLIDTPLEEHQKDLVESIHSSGNTLLYLINDILDFSKIEANKIQLEKRSFSFEEIINSIAGTFSLQAEKKQIDFIIEISNELQPAYIGDEHRIKQILNNLISNALKFTELGEVRLIIEVDNKGILVKVRDTGIGISKEKIETLFDAFTQVDASVTRRYGGTGLGLAITKSLIELMNGEIRIESIEGEGACFIFNLPLEVDRTKKKKSSEEVTEEISFSKELKVLVVEDNKVNQKVVRRHLEKIGLECTLANNGLEGVEAVKKDDYDLIFMDMQMPILDGLEATRNIRHLELEKRPYIIALTANAFKEDEQKCREAGMDDYLAKPLTRISLINALMKFKDHS